MDVNLILADIADPRLMLPLLFSLLTGALIGAEREFKQKPAGLRTHTLVCFASALMTLVGLRMADWVAVLPPETQIVSDMSRMPHAILTGIGFLGAGVIFKGDATVQGLTTAATLWLTAALGVVYGTGLIELGLVGTVITLVVLVLLRFIQRLYPHPLAAEIEVSLSGDHADLAQLRSSLAARRVKAELKSAHFDAAAARMTYTFLAHGSGEALRADSIFAALADLPGQPSVRLDMIAE